jgi:hypothetical protein
MSRREKNEMVHYQQVSPQQQLEYLLRQLQQQQYGQMMQPQQFYPQPMQPYHQLPRRVRHKKAKKGMSGGTVVGLGFVAFLLSWGWMEFDAPGMTFLTWVGIATFWMSHILGWIRRR